MKIAHICLSLGTGGAEKILVDTLPLYKALGHDVSIIQLSSKLEEKKYIDKMKQENIPVYSLSKKGFYQFSYFRKLKKIISKNQYDIVHVHLFPCFYYIALLKFFNKITSKIVCTEHSITNGRRNKKFFKFVESFIYEQYDAIISISKFVDIELKKYLPQLHNKFFLINNGVNISSLAKTLPYDRQRFIQDNKLSQEAKLLMMTARFSPPKDQNTLIKALDYLPDNVHIILIGDGPRMHESQKLAKQYDKKVIFLGFRDDTPQLMKMVDINTLSTHYEGFSGVTLEGLSCEKPFLGSDVVGVNDIVPDSRFLFKKGNEKELASKIKLIIEDEQLANDMIQTAKKHVAQFDTQIAIDKHLTLYKQLLEN